MVFSLKDPEAKSEYADPKKLPSTPNRENRGNYFKSNYAHYVDSMFVNTQSRAYLFVVFNDVLQQLLIYNY